jgi:predicted membrane-bound spermidine synthase
MSRALLYAIVFIEGFCSLGAEVIALRRLVPHVGSSIVITAPTIGFFLLALALGYASGAKVAADYPGRRPQFPDFRLLAGIGLAGITVDWLFAHLQPTLVAYLVFIGGVLCPLAWLLGQTVPILTNLMQAERTGEASGMALYWSTLGSFLGSLTLSLIVMQWLGVSPPSSPARPSSPGHPARRRRQWATGGAGLGVALAAGFNAHHAVTADTAYADYLITPVAREGQPDSRAFFVNKSLASLIDDSEPPHYTRYIRHLRQVLLDDLGYRDRDILVLGAGGFTLSHREPLNRYTYVDIDPKIRDIAEQHS